MSRIFRPRDEDSIPLQLEEFDACPVAAKVWAVATPLCRQERRNHSNRSPLKDSEFELRGLRVFDRILIARFEVDVEKQYRNTEYLGVSLSGCLELLEFLHIKEVSRSLLKSKFLPLKRRPEWQAADFNLPNLANHFAEILSSTFEAPAGSNIAASDLFGSFRSPEKAWTKENLEWTGQKFVLHPTFSVRVAETRAEGVYDEGLFSFLAQLPFPVERSSQMHGFDASAQRVAWARYEHQRQRLEKSIAALEKELEELHARQTKASESLRFDRERLERLKLEAPDKGETKGKQT